MRDIIDTNKPFAIILLNLGGPDTVEAVRPFLRNLFSDSTIIKLPMQPIMARVISRSRAKKVTARYEAIGGGSPILRLTEAQAAGLESNLKNKGLDCRVYVGMSYWHPFISETIERIAADGFEQILAVSLFPQYSKATTGACLSELKKAIDKLEKPLQLDTLESWFDDDGYLKALAGCVKAGLDKFPPEQREAVTVLFSAHSLPQSFVDDGDPYPKEIAGTINGILARLEPITWRLAYQSRSGPVTWMEPQTDAAIEEIAAAGVKNVLVVPISFVSDHIETLFEIDIMYKQLAKSKGIEVFERCPSLNNSPPFIDALTGIVTKKLAPDKTAEG